MERIVWQDIFGRDFHRHHYLPGNILDRPYGEQKKLIEQTSMDVEEGNQRKQEKVIKSCMRKTAHVSCPGSTAVRGADPVPLLVAVYCARIPGYIWAPLNRTSGNPRQKLKQGMLSPRSRGNSPGRHHNQVPGIWEHCGEHLRNLHRLGQWPSRCKKKGGCPPWSRPVAGRQSR